MKTLLVLLIPFISFAQLGRVGIETVNPTKTLDVNGELRVRELPLVNGSLLSSDTLGNVGVSGFSFGLYSVSASAPVEVRTTGPFGRTSIIRGIDLGMVLPVTIPAGTTAKILVSYFVPFGVVTSPETLSCYQGTILFRNGTEVPGASTKFQMDEQHPIAALANVNGTFRMANITTTYLDTYDNTGSSPAILTYSLKGYVEEYYSSDNNVTYRFNMWSATGDNFNWGKSVMVIQVITGL